MSLAIECKNLKKKYGEKGAEVFALRGVNLEVNPGELVMLVGPSGCGKTTLLSIISGILTPDEGQCKIFGQDIHTLHNDEKTDFRGKNIGFVFQSFNLIPMLTAKENGAIPLLINGHLDDEAKNESERLLTNVGLKNRLEAYPHEMSGGEQQRIAIVRSCIHRPKIVVSDEPTSALDGETGVKVMELFKGIALREDSAVIIVTHDTRILPFAHRILYMEDGKIIN